MSASRRHRIALVLAIGALTAALVAAPATAAKKRGGGGGGAVTVPGNFRVIGMTPYSVTFGWDASQSTAGIASYTICCADVSSLTVAGTETSGTLAMGILPGYTHTYRISAKDNEGRYSSYSDPITVTTPLDKTAPSKPTVSVTEVGPRHVSLVWSATDDDPRPYYTVFVNGSPFLQSVRETSGTITPLAYETTFSFTVRARDSAGNLSPLSDPVAATTLPKDAGDTTAPTAPPGLTSTLWMPDGETWLDWGDSFDAVTPSSRIVYRVYINGILEGAQVGYTQTVVYGTPMSQNTYAVDAIDESGNVSALSVIVIDNN